MMGELKPCPFCYDTWLYYSDMNIFKWKVNCECGYAWDNSTWEDTKEEAIEAWNRRVDNGDK